MNNRNLLALVLSVFMLTFGIVGIFNTTPNTKGIIDIYAVGNNCCDSSCGDSDDAWTKGYHQCAAGQCSKCSGGSKGCDNDGKCESGESEGNCSNDCKRGGQDSSSSNNGGGGGGGGGDDDKSTGNDNSGNGSGGACGGPLSAKACKTKSPGDNVQGVCTCQRTTGNNCACIGFGDKPVGGGDESKCSGSSECASGACRLTSSGHRECVPKEVAKVIDGGTINPEDVAPSVASDKSDNPNARCLDGTAEIESGKYKGQCTCVATGKVISKNTNCTGYSNTPDPMDADGNPRCKDGSRKTGDPNTCECRDIDDNLNVKVYGVPAGEECKGEGIPEGSYEKEPRCGYDSTLQSDGSCRCNRSPASNTNDGLFVKSGESCVKLVRSVIALSGVPVRESDLYSQCHGDINCDSPIIRQACINTCQRGIARDYLEGALDAEQRIAENIRVQVLTTIDCTPQDKTCVNNREYVCDAVGGGYSKTPVGRCEDNEFVSIGKLIKNCSKVRYDINCNGLVDMQDASSLGALTGLKVIDPLILGVISNIEELDEQINYFPEPVTFGSTEISSMTRVLDVEKLASYIFNPPIQEHPNLGGGGCPSDSTLISGGSPDDGKCKCNNGSVVAKDGNCNVCPANSTLITGESPASLNGMCRCNSGGSVVAKGGNCNVPNVCPANSTEITDRSPASLNGKCECSDKSIVSKGDKCPETTNTTKCLVTTDGSTCGTNSSIGTDCTVKTGDTRSIGKCVSGGEGGICSCGNLTPIIEDEFTDEYRCTSGHNDCAQKILFSDHNFTCGTNGLCAKDSTSSTAISGGCKCVVPE